MKTRIFFSPSLMIFLLSIVVLAQPTDANKLSFEMFLTKDKVIPLEPIQLTLRVENKTSKPLRIEDGYISITNHLLKLSIQKPDGTVIVPKQLSGLLGSRVGSRTFDIRPGEVRETTEELQFRLEEYFDQVGEYKLKATHPNGSHDLETEWMKLTVNKPTGVDLAAYEFIMLARNNNGLSSLSLFGIHAEREEFLMKFPKSVYADFIRYSLASSYAAEQKPKALELLRKIRRDNPDFIKLREVNQKIRELEGHRPVLAKEDALSEAEQQKLIEDATRIQEVLEKRVAAKFPELKVQTSRIFTDPQNYPRQGTRPRLTTAWTGEQGMFMTGVELYRNEQEAFRGFKESIADPSYQNYFRAPESLGPFARLKKDPTNPKVATLSVHYPRGSLVVGSSFVGLGRPLNPADEKVVIEFVIEVAAVIDSLGLSL